MKTSKKTAVKPHKSRRCFIAGIKPYTIQMVGSGSNKKPVIRPLPVGKVLKHISDILKDHYRKSHITIMISDK